MGIGDLHDERPRQVSPGEHAQHLLRLRSGRIVNGLRGHRIVWALVNSVLVGEAAGKGFAVHRNVMKRLGGRVEGTSVLTRRRLREMIENDESYRSIVGQLMTVGRDVRSTPMQWSYEGKKLDCAVKHLAWRPPWVKSSEVGEPDPAAPFVQPEHMVEDRVGLNRIPVIWFTLNCKYNSAYDIHRLNVAAQFARPAVESLEDEHRQVRFDFSRDAPDIVTYMVSLRAELQMRW